MEELNYHYLRYFWAVAREGSVSAAARRLHLAPSTVSAQVRLLQDQLGYPLLERSGRGMVLTERGEVVLRYADDIFALGEELMDVVRHDSGPRHTFRLRVGVATNLPKTMALRLIQPGLRLPDYPVQLVVTQGQTEALVRSLATHHLDLLLMDDVVGLSAEVAARCVPLGSCGVTLMGTPAVVARHLVDFPASLEGAPMLLPDTGSAMRRELEVFFARTGLAPEVVAEFDDSALMKSFGRTGLGLFPVPSLVASEVGQSFGVVQLGVVPNVSESFYAVVLPGRRANPAVGAILAGAEGTFVQTAG